MAQQAAVAAHAVGAAQHTKSLRQQQFEGSAASASTPPECGWKTRKLHDDEEVAARAEHVAKWAEFTGPILDVPGSLVSSCTTLRGAPGSWSAAHLCLDRPPDAWDALFPISTREFEETPLPHRKPPPTPLRCRRPPTPDSPSTVVVSTTQEASQQGGQDPQRLQHAPPQHRKRVFQFHPSTNPLDRALQRLHRLQQLHAIHRRTRCKPVCAVTQKQQAAAVKRRPVRMAARKQRRLEAAKQQDLETAAVQRALRAARRRRAPKEE